MFDGRFNSSIDCFLYRYIQSQIDIVAVDGFDRLVIHAWQGIAVLIHLIGMKTISTGEFIIKIFLYAHPADQFSGIVRFRKTQKLRAEGFAIRIEALIGITEIDAVEPLYRHDLIFLLLSQISAICPQLDLIEARI